MPFKKEKEVCGKPTQYNLQTCEYNWKQLPDEHIKLTERKRLNHEVRTPELLDYLHNVNKQKEQLPNRSTPVSMLNNNIRKNNNYSYNNNNNNNKINQEQEYLEEELPLLLPPQEERQTLTNREQYRLSPELQAQRNENQYDANIHVINREIQQPSATMQNRATFSPDNISNNYNNSNSNGNNSSQNNVVIYYSPWSHEELRRLAYTNDAEAHHSYLHQLIH